MAPLAETLKLNGYSTAQFGKCHEVPVWETSPMGPFDRLAGRRRRVRVLLRLHRRREQPVGPGPVRGDDAASSRRGPPEEGYHLTEDLADHAISWVRQQKALDAGQAVLHVLRAGRDPRPAPRAQGVDRQVQGQVRARLGQPARDHLREAEGAGRDRPGCGADPAARRDPGLGRHGSGAQAGARARDGGLRRPSWSTPTTTSGG